MPDAPKEEIGQGIVSGIDDVDLMQFAAEVGCRIWEHLQDGGEVYLRNHKTNETRRLVRTKHGLKVLP